MCIYIYGYTRIKEILEKYTPHLIVVSFGELRLTRKKGTFPFHIILNSVKDKDPEKRNTDLMAHKNIVFV